MCSVSLYPGVPAHPTIFAVSVPTTDGIKLLSKSPLPFHLVPIAAVSGRVTSGTTSITPTPSWFCMGPFFARQSMVGAKSVMRPPERPVSKPLAVPFPVPRLGAGCQPLPSMIGSSASATDHLPAPPRASTKTRFRRWAKPKCWASRVRQATHRLGPSTTPALGHFGTCLFFAHLQKALLLPDSGRGPGSIAWSFPAKPPKKAPKALSLVLKTPGTFSQRIQAGSLPAVDRRWSIASASSTN